MERECSFRDKLLEYYNGIEMDNKLFDYKSKYFI